MVDRTALPSSREEVTFAGQGDTLHERWQRLLDSRADSIRGKNRNQSAQDRGAGNRNVTRGCPPNERYPKVGQAEELGET
jgi:hypothetical protein